jgi:hypothetical protein
VNPARDTQAYGPWHPGIQSQVPKELWHLATIFRPENVFTSIATVSEMQGLTGFSPSELVAFRPQRLALHELLIRVTADFAVPDGSRIGDLGINFREIAASCATQSMSRSQRWCPGNRRPQPRRPSHRGYPGCWRVSRAGAAQRRFRLRLSAAGVRAISRNARGSRARASIHGRKSPIAHWRE